MLKNKRIIVYGVIGVVIITFIVCGIIVYKNRNQNKEIAGVTPEVKNTTDITNKNNIEDVKQVIENKGIEPIEQENKKTESVITSNTSSSNKTNQTMSNNTKKEVLTSPKKDNTIINNKQEITEKPKQEVVSTPPKQEETKHVKKEEFKPNMKMANQMVEIIKANPGQFMKDYGYEVVIDKSIIEKTNQFTFTKQRIIDKISQKAGTIKVYSQDYYVDGKLVWIECYLF